MSKSLSVAISILSHKNTIKLFGCLIFNPSRLTEPAHKKILNKIVKDSKLSPDQLAQIVNDWWQGKTAYIAINHQNISGLQVRLYKADFNKSGKNIKALNVNQQGSVYYRYRNNETQKLVSTKLGHFDPALFCDIVKAVKQIKASNELGIQLLTKSKNHSKSNVPTITLHEFLKGRFLEKKVEENPKTADKKVKVVTRYFSNLLKLNIKEVNAEKIRAWLKSKERKLTQKQINAGESRWVLKPSTLKEAICTIRSCVQLAKEDGLISDHDLYTLPKFKMDNDIIRYLSKDEELRLYKVLNQRNQQKLEQRISTIEHRKMRGLPTPPNLDVCAFADHVTPFIILFKETGIRPGTIMNSKWTDIDMEARFFRIRKSIDKRALANFVPLNDLAFSVITEWRKHHIHKECRLKVENRKDAWLFPSPQDPKHQLTSVKTAWTTLIKQAKIENFRFYDLRHDFASKVMMQTGNIYLVSNLLNHRQVETTKRYAHLMDESKIKAVKLLDLYRDNSTLPDFLKSR
ncbi:site-specific integrase [Thalassotalea ponticola]|uniref:tyrosine-type recombinase/integrase n=1 Tax=Thalassotalea ponticola TaxID=1523392 RepID=UPI0025B3C40A|nr:site-specific integrase [Thalassotalea ponticola]MDN3651490.1 site-specific integrase [Thalassotalea ponticola]